MLLFGLPELGSTEVLFFLHSTSRMAGIRLLGDKNVTYICDKTLRNPGPIADISASELADLKQRRAFA